MSPRLGPISLAWRSRPRRVAMRTIVEAAVALLGDVNLLAKQETGRDAVLRGYEH